MEERRETATFAVEKEKEWKAKVILWSIVADTDKKKALKNLKAININ